MAEKLITKSFERLFDKGKHRGFITFEELGKSLGKRNSTYENVQSAFIILNYLTIASKKLEDLSEIEFLSEKNESLKKEITNNIIEGNDKDAINKKINNNYDKIIEEINENSNIQIIIKNKNDDEISNLLDELLKDHKEQSNLRQIESLEQKLINNLDENSYSELIKLKSQLNRE